MRGHPAAKIPLTDRLVAKRRERSHPTLPTPCWEWTGWIDKYGYGQISYLGKLRKVPRAALHAFKGMPLDAPEWALHACDNPACFNPDHLRPGTPTENNWETWQRKRQNVRRKDNGHFAPPTTDLPF